MILYHGTNHRFLAGLVKDGIRCRGTAFPNQWPGKGTRSDLVYLTKCFGPLYAQNAVRGTGDNWLILEVHIPYANLSRLLPDEAYRAAIAGQEGESPERIMELESEYRRTLEKHRDDWKSSLNYVGNVAIKSSIRSTAIRRYCVLDPELRKEFVWEFIQAVQTRRLPHDIVLPYFEGVTSWLFGDRARLPVPPGSTNEQIEEFVTRESTNRVGISVTVI